MSDIVLSRGVRNNLLNLQRTADSISVTQNRLATGKKVNSTLDNPTNFFTASSLNSRAADLGNLLDSMSNGIKTLEAADNGLKSITRTVESMQSTLRQARQDRSFKSTSFTLPSSPTGTLSISGGSVTGTRSFSLAATTAVNTTLNSAQDLSGSFAGGTIGVNGTNVTIRGDQTAVATTLNGTGATFAGVTDGGTVSINGTNISIRGDRSAIASSRGPTGGADLTTGVTNLGLSGNATLTLTSGGNTATVNLTAASTNADLDTLNTAGFTVARGASGLTISRADGANFSIASTGADAATLRTRIGQTDATVNNGTTAFDATVSTVIADITAAGISGLTASNNSGQVALSLSSGAALTLAGNSTVLTQIGFGTGNTTSSNGREAFDATTSTVAADINAAGITGLSAAAAGNRVNLTLSTGADLTLDGNDSLLTAIGFTSGANRLSTNGTEAFTPTVDALVSQINADSGLTNRVRASNDGGRLRLENLSTENLSVVGADSNGAITGGTGSANTQTVGGNEVRKNLIGQFNELRGQLDKLAEDASFNGINLLRGDRLRLSFNEIGTSQLDIQAKDAAGNVRAISTADSSLNIDTVDASTMQSDSAIDARLAGLGDALTTLRTQSSAFGSNLSVVQNRQDFTKSMMSTLRTGADSLTLADMNEEAANLLSLQTRQQLASTSLSLANQADQGVLRLF